MSRTRWIVCFLMLGLASVVAASPISMEDRTVLAATDPTAGLHAAAFVQVAPGEVEMVLPIGEEVTLVERMWAMHVRFADGLSAGPSLMSNGQLVMMDAFRRSDGYLYRLGPGQLQHGINRLRLTSQGGDLLAVEHCILFSLHESFEVVHFGMAFADSGRREAMTSVQPPSHPDQLKFDVQHYHLFLKPMMASTYLEGEMTMTARALDAGLEQVVLDFHPNEGLMVVTGVDGGEGTGSLPFSHDAADKRLYIQLPLELEADEEFVVRVAYEGIPNEESRFGAPYRRTTLGGQPLVFTLSQPYGARTWWPCKDTPEDKAILSSTVDIPPGFTLVTNGVTLSVDETEEGLIRWEHTHEYPVATYLVSIAIGYFVPESDMYTSREGTTQMPIRNYFRLGPGGSTETLPTMKSALEVFSELFVEYPFINEKYEQVYITGTTSMEHQTASSMSYPVPSWVTVHEVAHQWFGNKVGFAHHDHLWLSESWATYCEGLFVESTSGPSAFQNWLSDKGLAQPIIGGFPLVSEQADSFWIPILYTKGAAILHTLRYWVGDEAFFEGARGYLNEHAYDAAVTSDLQLAMEAASGQDLDPFFQSWVYNATIPTIDWRWWRVGNPTEEIVIEVRQLSSGAIFPFAMEGQLFPSGGGTIPRGMIRVEDGVGRVSIRFPYPRVLSSAIASTWTAPQILVTSNTSPKSLGIKAIDGGFQFDFQPATAQTLANKVQISPDGITWSDFSPPVALRNREGRVMIPTSAEKLYVRVIAPVQSGPSRYSDPFLGVSPRQEGDVLLVLPRSGVNTWYLQTAEALESLGVGVTMVSREMPGVFNEDPKPSAVIWLQGSDPLAQDLLLPQDASIIARILDAGWPLLLSGSTTTEVSGMTASEALVFQQQYLKVMNTSPVTVAATLIGEAGDILDGLTMTAVSPVATVAMSFDPVGEAMPIAVSSGDGRIVAHRYIGPMPNTSGETRFILAGFNIDGIHDLEMQREVWKRMLQFLGLNVPDDGEVRDWMLID